MKIKYLLSALVIVSVGCYNDPNDIDESLVGYWVDDNNPNIDLDIHKSNDDLYTGSGHVYFDKVKPVLYSFTMKGFSENEKCMMSEWSGSFVRIGMINGIICCIDNKLSCQIPNGDLFIYSKK